MRASQFVGRQAQLEDIQQHLYHIMTGQPRVVMVQGIAGIGKTRFLEQVRTMADEMGLQVFAGHCSEALTQPYAPFSDLLLRLQAEPLLGELEEDDILDETDVSILREFSRHPAPSLQQGPVYHAEADKLRIMMAISRAATRFALQTPMLIQVDDLHLADSFSLDVFAYLAFFMAEQRTAPLLLLGSYREVATESNLGRLLSRLIREGISREMDLAGLDDTETRALLRDLGVVQPTHQLVNAIQETTHGIPLFIEEVVPHLIKSGALYGRGGYLSTRRRVVETLRLPHTIPDAIAARMASLPERFYATLTVAACLGETFSVERLQCVKQIDASALWEAIEAGIDAGVILCESTQCRFAHALIRHAFQARLRPAERQRLHLHIAQVLETLYADHLENHILEIAHHIVEAGDLADAHTVVPFVREAGDRAFALFDWREAARYYEAALRAVDSAQGFSEQLKADLHYQVGLAHYRHQDAGPAQDYFDRAVQMYRALGDARGLANTLVWRTMLQFMHASIPVGVLPDIKQLHDTLDLLGDTDPVLSGNFSTGQIYKRF